MSKTYRITLDYEYETEAETDEEAIKAFWENVIYDTQTDPGTFISENLCIEEAKPKKFTVTKFHDTGGDLTEETWEIEADDWEEAAEMAMEDQGLMVLLKKKGGVAK